MKEPVLRWLFGGLAFVAFLLSLAFYYSAARMAASCLP